MPTRRPGRRGKFPPILALSALALALTLANLIAAGAIVGGAYALFTSVFNNTDNAFTTDTLDPPTLLSASPSGSDIRLDWTATVDTYATGYKVLRSMTQGSGYSEIDTVTPYTTITYPDNTVSGGVTYYYVLQSYYQNWTSANSNEASAMAGNAVSLVSSADSYVQQDAAGSNYGDAVLMDVGSMKDGGTPTNRRSFVKFDVSSIPASSTVSSANLTLCATVVASTTRTYDVHAVSADWVEMIITWSNQPSVAASATDSTTTPSSPGCMTWDVAADVQAWVDGTSNYGWRVVDAAESAPGDYLSQFRTHENSVTAERPTLDVTYTPP